MQRYEAAQGEERHVSDALPAQVSDKLFVVAMGQVVVVLHADHLGNALGLLDLRGRDVAQAQVADQALALRLSGKSASSLSDAVRRMESRLGVRLLNRTTRSVVPTEASARLMERIVPALGEVEAAMDVVNDFRDHPSGTLRLNVPVSAARLVLPAIITPFLKSYPDIRLEVVTEESFVDMLAACCDAGIRYDERLEQDMIALPIGPRFQRFAAEGFRGLHPCTTGWERACSRWR